MPSGPNSLPPSNERLESWKEIASYLKKGVRTVQRWERTEGLPVRRLGQDRTGFVFAYKSEVDAWWLEQSRRIAPQPESIGSAESAQTRTGWHFAAILSTIILSTAAIVWTAVVWKPWITAPIDRTRPGCSTILLARRPADRLRVDSARRPPLHPYKEHRLRIRHTPHVRRASGSESGVVAGRPLRRFPPLSKPKTSVRSNAHSRSRRTGE
jgi:hypothetical protein